MLRRFSHTALGAALIAGAAMFAPAAHAGGGVGFNVSIGGPGYAFSVGNAPYYGYRHHHYHPYVAAYAAPPVVYGPPVAYVAPPIVYAPPRVVYRAPYVVRRPVVVAYPY